jgi:hypothetical protein
VKIQPRHTEHFHAGTLPAMRARGVLPRGEEEEEWSSSYSSSSSLRAE